MVLSLVRSSERIGGKKGDGIGFLRDNRRLNVAVTRAKRHCAVICDSETVSQSNFVKGLIAWIEEHGEQRSALDFLSGSNDMNNDLRDAEIELQKAMAQLAKDEQNKASPMQPAKQLEPNKMDDEAKRRELLDKIARFSEVGSLGEEMSLCTELTAFDRRVVHEFAEQIDLGHRSEGEGENRRIILKIEQTNLVSQPPAINEPPKAEAVDSGELANESVPATTTTSTFAALAVYDEESESDTEEPTAKNQTDKHNYQSPAVELPASNNLLADLARERALREKEKQKIQSATFSKGPDSTKKKKKGQKLGGKKPASKDANKDDEALDELDDLAFLDKQIEKVQTSHGRQMFGSGNNYKTVINGILISKPQPREKEKNTRASAALQSKIKKAQGDRKAKTKKS